MRITSLTKLCELQKHPANVRNICILAHVDHGKTTLADTLVASNGIISQRMAGKLRYMDSREDEQIRGITMKSSGISLVYEKDKEEFLINLIDSPGHIDFSSEVSTAVRLCDGAIVVVDVIEGVCPQTHAVLRQAWLEDIKPVLILNKLDRLITEWKMAPVEAYLHLQQILEQVNVLTSELFTSGIMEKTSQVQEKPKSPPAGSPVVNQDKVYDWSLGVEETDDSHIYFSPDLGNVIFASALDGWGFSIDHFAELFAKKLGINADVLRKTLWGDFYLNSKSKRIVKGAQHKGKKPLFVQFILENLWSVYDAIFIQRDKDKMEKIINSLNLNISARDSRHSDPRVLIQAVCSQWLPLSHAVLSMVISNLPSPLCMSEQRVEKLMCSQSQRFDSLPHRTQKLKQAFADCSGTDDAAVIIYVSKMINVDRKSLPQNRARPLSEAELQMRHEHARKAHADRLAGNTTPDTETPEPVSLEDMSGSTADDEDQVFLAFARIFSGTVKRGQKLYILGPKHDPSRVHDEFAASSPDNVVNLKHVQEFIVGDLYLFMGRELELLDEVPAGNVIGIGGLQDMILKSATLSDTIACPSFTDMHFEPSPIVRVAIEPKHASEMGVLKRGLQLLNQADPCVQVAIQETGEHVIVAAGEVHLQRCIEDLKLRYGKLDLNVSSPIVPFRETIITPPKMDRVNENIEDQIQPMKPQKEKQYEDDDNDGSITDDESVKEEVLEAGLIDTHTSNRKCRIRIRAEPLPDAVTDLLEEHASLIKTLDKYMTAQIARKSELHAGAIMSGETKQAMLELKSKLEKCFCDAGKRWLNTVDEIWSFGPRRNGPNVLLNHTVSYHRPNIWSCLNEAYSNANGNQIWDYDNSIVSGFQLATFSGPLCEEPLRGVCFSIEELTVDGTSLIISSQHCALGSVSVLDGQLTLHTVPLHKLKIQNISLNCDRENFTIDTSVPQSNIPRSIVDISPATITDRIPESLSESTTREEDTLANSLNSDKAPHTDKLTPSLYTDLQHRDHETSSQSSTKQKKVYGPFSGQLMSCIKDGCRKAFQTQPQRLMVAMYKCDIQATTDVLGKLYAVLSKRCGHVLSEDMREGAQIFNIQATLPVVESFGFAEDIRKKTSGLASPQLKLSHWEVIDLDPFWVPTTEEEYLHFGEKADSENRARKYMNDVRKRKGLKVDEKIVEHAEKQRTISRKK